MGILNSIAARFRDPHGQPINTAFRSEAVIDRQIDELIGIIKGVIADGHINQNEAEFLLRWMETNRAAAAHWPANVLQPRLASALYDGNLDDHEEGELLELILQCAGGDAPAHGEASMSTVLPLTRPEPTVEFPDRSFCFTGKFCSGTRDWCEAQVVARGGTIGAITKDLNYLVIGGSVRVIGYTQRTAGRLRGRLNTTTAVYVPLRSSRKSIGTGICVNRSDRSRSRPECPTPSPPSAPPSPQ